MIRYVNATIKIAKKCGIKKMFKYIIGGLLFRKTRIIDNVFYKLRSKNKVTYVNGLPAIKTYINMEIIGIKSKIPIYVPSYDKGLSRDLLVYHGIREPVHIKVLYETIKNSGIRKVADIGSNIGYFPLIELHAGAKHIIALEPVPDTFRYLKINLEDCPNCIMMNAAVDLNETSKKIYVHLDENGYPMLNLASFNKDSLNKVYKRITDYEVKTLSFSKILNKYKPEMVRMDIEGYEWVLLSHTQNIPENVYLIDMEVHYCDLSKVRKSLEHLKNNGFYKATVIVNPNILTFPVYVLSKILGVQRSVDLINKISLIEEVEMCKYSYLFKKSINYVSIDCLINKLQNFLSYTGEVQVIFERKY